MDNLEITAFQIMFILISIILFDPLLSRKISEWF